uniref:NADH dehydrogenase subunit 6 n=1 Tax=Periphykon beckeri TaxID=2006982 RepID=UPI0022FD69EC|nr:NADH dehydrogenase subunit 6 [Periphykon beckeri]WAX04140.1 NADH dehydrogenase subunit 6 [Periphykon beckeri]
MEFLLFNFLLLLIICSALLVIFSENSVYAVLFLILTFFNVILLLLLLGAEFLAFLFLIVYVGAIAVLFLFVIMMLNIKTTNLFYVNQLLIYYLPLSIVSLFLFIDTFLNFCLFFDILNTLNLHLKYINWFNELNGISNTKVLGNILYTNYCFLFIIASLILLVAMVGVIILTVHQKTICLLQKQNINLQIVQNSKNLIKFIYLRN